MSHIAVERNRRRQMNEHLKVLRSLTPGFYIKRFIKELHLVLRSLEAKKKRRRISLSPSPSPRSLLPVTPPPEVPSSAVSRALELGACCSSPVADIEVKISGCNVILRTLSKRIPGQAARVISVLEKLSFEVLHLNISTMEDTVLYSFVIKIGLDCKLSVEDLALEVQKCFSQEVAH
ncbi:unnamed protein product [Spirodela intermedia]|uniref:BHLH domain-containing protein n=1 Tax=Spirodela intermedia TaxID=51605 RepID=A0A7I8J2B6_SPIIN|nr:unnamed protein product [Spirodela intermedia]CAA6663521.1 unnamed protein product [Spirodela intermedia]